MIFQLKLIREVHTLSPIVQFFLLSAFECVIDETKTAIESIDQFFVDLTRSIVQIFLIDSVREWGLRRKEM